MRVLSICIFALVIMLIAGCFSNPPYPKMPKCKSNRELSAQDMSNLSWEFKTFIGNNVIQTSNSPPVRNIKIIWTLDEISHPFRNIIVNDDGTILYSPGDELYPGIVEELYKKSIAIPVYPLSAVNIVNRVKSDGSIDYKATLAEHQEFKPIAAYNNAVIIYSWGQDNHSNMVRLECIDYDLNTIWCTVPIEMKPWTYSWPISQDEIAMFTGTLEDLVISIYNAKNGELTKSVHFACDIDFKPAVLMPDMWDIDASVIKMIRLLDNSWLGIINNYVVSFNNDLSLKWQYKLPVKYSPPSVWIRAYLSKQDYLMISTFDELFVIDVNNGDVVWQPTQGMDYMACGVSLQGDFLFYSTDLDEVTTWINAVTPKGEKVWSRQIPNYPDVTATIIYGDGSILFSHSKGITLLNVEGKAIWDFRNKDFGVPEEASFYRWQLVPAPDNRIICSFSVSTDEKASHHLICLGSAH